MGGCEVKKVEAMWWVDAWEDTVHQLGSYDNDLHITSLKALSFN